MSAPIQNNQVSQLLQTRTAPAAQPANSAAPAGGVDFSAVLADRLQLSNHAKTRLQSRDLNLDRDQWERVMSGVDKAALKGAKESLVMVDDAALIVSVRNRTVITAVSQQQLKDNVFTNIDSAVIV
ncbi:MAG: flagellar biosynthesis protein [Armatimonadetes bacterium]|nr:flagellar biosynthesis protein [Armatimonadota bacterium]